MRRWLAAVFLVACAQPQSAPPATLANAGDSRPRCDSLDDDGDRLVVDWSPLDRSKLESAARHGVVAVRVDECRAKIADACTVKRTYAFAATSRQREVMVVRDRDELGAKLPILAMKLGASFSQSAALDVTMTVVGRYEAGASSIALGDLEGECEGVTHVVANMSVGAFNISTKSAREIEGSIDVVHGSHARERTRVDSAGLEEQCALARRADDAPPEDCSIPLRVELRAVVERAATSKPPPVVVDPNDMKHAMENAKKQIVPCHRAARATSPNLSGVLTLAVKLGRRGNVRSVSAKHQGNLDDTLAECAAERVALVNFPPADDDRPRSLVIPIMFAPLQK